MYPNGQTIQKLAKAENSAKKGISDTQDAPFCVPNAPSCVPNTLSCVPNIPSWFQKIKFCPQKIPS